MVERTRNDEECPLQLEKTMIRKIRVHTNVYFPSQTRCLSKADDHSLPKQDALTISTHSVPGLCL